MKLTIVYENKKLSLTLNSSIRVKELICELSKKLKIKSTDKVCLFNSPEMACYDEQDFISNKEDQEILLITLNNLKKNSVKKQPERQEELIKYCTNAKDTIKPNRQHQYKSYYGSGSKYKAPLNEHDYDYFKEIVANSSDQSAVRSKLDELMYKFETMKEEQNISNAIKKDSSNRATVNSKDVEVSSKASIRFSKAAEKFDKEREREKDKKTTSKYTGSYYKPVEKVLKIEADPVKLENLVCMGFEEERCKKALVISNNNLEHATELLLGGSDFELFDQVNNTVSTNPYYGGYSGYGGGSYGGGYSSGSYGAYSGGLYGAYTGGSYGTSSATQPQTQTIPSSPKKNIIKDIVIPSLAEVKESKL